MNIATFLFIYFLQIFLTFPKFSHTCKALNLVSYGTYFTHHLLDVFLFWAPLFLTTTNEFIIHIIVSIGVIIHWFTYNNRCIATVYMNRLCGYPEDDWLDSLKNMLGLRNISEYFHFIWIGLVLVYDIYMITSR